MEIRKKITYQFIAIVALILFLTSTAVYVSFSETRKEEFYDRLTSKAKLVAQMLIEIDEIDAALLRRIERNNPLSLPNEKIIIYDNHNNQIYSNDESNTISITGDLVNQVRKEVEIKFDQEPSEILGYFYATPSEEIVVFIAATDIFGHKKLERLQIILVVVLIIGLIIVFFAGRIFASRALKPISNIITQVDGISISNLNERVDEGNGRDEIARLAATFNKMLARLETAFNVQKNFIANASHELHTPLTVLTGHLEVELLKPRQIEEYQSTINSVLSEIKNLTEISNRLLLLAQTSSELAKTNFFSFRIDDSLWQARNEIMKRHADYNVNIRFGNKIDDDGLLMIYGNPPLLKTAIVNLMDNGCKYSTNKHVDVYLDLYEKDYINIKFIDNGIGISEEEKKMIFQPFYRSKDVMNIKGHGIGLSLVEKIINLHNGKIFVESSPGKGSTFAVSLPINNR